MSQSNRWGGLAALAGALALALPAPVMAEEEAAKGAAKPMMHAEKEKAANTVFVLPVQGLTQENAGAAADALRAVQHEKERILTQVTPDVTKGNLTLSFLYDRTLRLSQIEASLKASGVQVKRDALEIPKDAQFVLKGATTADAIAQVKKSLESAKIFQTFTVRTTKEEGELLVMPKFETPVKYSAVWSAVEKMETGHHLTDVVWVSPPPPQA
jgi:hypothetical protein